MKTLEEIVKEIEAAPDPDPATLGPVDPGLISFPPYEPYHDEDSSIEKTGALPVRMII